MATNVKQQAAQAPAGTRRSVTDDISGTYNDPEKIRTMLAQAEENYILFGGLAQGDIPDGFSVMLSVFKVNPDNKKEVYSVGGGLFGLGGLVLNKLADAAGISMVESRCLAERLHYIHWQVTIARQCLDGSVRRIPGSRIMDLRESSGVVAAMRRAAASKNEDAENSIWGQRLHIGQHAETKAYLRAVRSMLGVGTYSKEDLAKKPIAVAKLQLTGRSNNPQTAALLTMMIAQQSLGGMAMLYGAPQPQMMGMGMPQMGGGQQAPQMGMGSPGPMILTTDDVEDGDGAGAAAQPPPPAKPPAPRRARNAADVFMPGKDKGKVGDAEDKDLMYWRDRLTKDFAEGRINEQYAARNQEQLDAIIATLRHRGLMPPAQATGGVPGAPASQPGEDDGPSSEDFRRMQADERAAGY